MLIATSAHTTRRLVEMRLELEDNECDFILTSHADDDDANSSDCRDWVDCERRMMASLPQRFESVAKHPRYTAECIEVKQGLRSVGDAMELRGTPAKAIFRPFRGHFHRATR